VPTINQWATTFAENVEIIVVYIEEAHASNVWPLGHFVDIPQHTCLADRQKAALLLREKFGLSPDVPVYLDSMENKFDEAFAVWPERYYTINDGHMWDVAEPTTEFGYDRAEFSNALNRVSDHIAFSKACAKSFPKEAAASAESSLVKPQ